MTATQITSGTLLGRMVQERMKQLGVSRRSFCMNNQISRQTLYEIEYKEKVNLMPTTLAALDSGLHWEPGTAARYACGDETPVEKPAAERVQEYVRRIVDHISLMTLEELERESIWLEEELFGRRAESPEDSMNMIREAFRRIIPELEGNESVGGQKRTARNRKTRKGD